MKNETKQKISLAEIYRLCPARHILLLISAAVIAAHLLLRHNYALMVTLTEKLVHPIHGALSRFNSLFPFSVAELLIGLAIVGVSVYIIFGIIGLIFNKSKIKRVYIIFATLLSLVSLVYAGFCLLWGTYYYGDDFMAKSGLAQEPISVEALEDTTRYFAELANESCGSVPRNAAGEYTADKRAILERSSDIFAPTVEQFPCLAGPDIDAKGIFFSRLMSYTDFTGFFFPFTAEANVNTDFPSGTFAATVAHELSHQRGVAKEQEANFTAVLACLNSDDPDYLYSGCLLAYTYLGNALYEADHEAWERVYDLLTEPVKRDLAANNRYWEQFETPVQTVTNTVYEGFLQSYEQTLGMKSYGACVDLLVNYYGKSENNP